MKNVIVTGATSMMGSALIRSLIRHKTDKIFAVVQPDSRNMSKIPVSDSIECIRCDCEEYSQLPNLILEGCDVFYHFAWIHSTLPDRERYFDVDLGYRNVGQTLQALEAASKIGCHTFVGAGSQAEYGNRRKRPQRPEDPSDPITAYAIAKDTCRRMSMLKAEELGINVQWVRIFSVYGPHDRKNTLISTILPKMCANEDISLTSCEQIWEYLYEDDAGEGLFYAGITPERKGSNIYCLGSGDAKQLKEFVAEMKRITHSHSRLQYGKIPNSRDMVMLLQSDISKLKNVTGWPGPKIAFEEGIIHCLEAWESDLQNHRGY